jgi:hypothetical protein
MEIKTIVNEGKRGCGYRKEGGTYLITDATELQDCGKLPLPLDVCPCCGQGIKAARAWTWVNAQKLFGGVECRLATFPSGRCFCPLSDESLKDNSRMGLLWIGEKFYKTPAEFLAEGRKQGFSRRLPMVPKDFELGKTWVLFAHRKAIRRVDICKVCDGKGFTSKMIPDINGNDGFVDVKCDECNGTGKMEEYTPGVFFSFRPERIEYIVKGDEKTEDLERKEKRGITLVKLVRTDDEEIDEDDGQPSEQQENEDFAHDTDEYNRDGSEML